MNQQPDKFFRDKLEHYQKTAPATAWDKISAARTKKNDKGLWLRIAASMLLLAVAGYLLWPETRSVEKQQSTLSEARAKQSTADTTTEQTTEEVEVTKTELNVETKNNFPVKTETATELTSSKRSTVIKSQIEEKRSTIAIVDEKQTEPVINDEAIIHDVATDSIETVIAEAQSNQEKETQNITLVYSAKEVDEYLNKNALAEATSRDKKPSTLKKLLQKANDLKNNQDPFGELRQKKNEILALNFKNEKRGQNK